MVETRHDFFVRRLKEMGLFDKDSDYDGLIGKWVEELSLKFMEQGHSEGSAFVTANVFNQLMNEYGGWSKPT